MPPNTTQVKQVSICFFHLSFSHASSSNADKFWFLMVVYSAYVVLEKSSGATGLLREAVLTALLSTFCVSEATSFNAPLPFISRLGCLNLHFLLEVTLY